MAERKPPKPRKTTTRWQRIARMDKEILDVEGAATLLGDDRRFGHRLRQQPGTERRPPQPSTTALAEAVRPYPLLS